MYKYAFKINKCNVILERYINCDYYSFCYSLLSRENREILLMLK